MILESSHDSELVSRYSTEVKNAWEDLIEEDAADTEIPPADVEQWLSKPAIQSALKSDNDTPESFFLTACSIRTILSRSTDSLFSSAFVLHSILIEHLSLSQRRLPAIKFTKEFDSAIDAYLETFAETATAILSTNIWAKAMEDITSDIVDIVDGRLFRTVSVFRLWSHI
jgi:hypothetical protein